MALPPISQYSVKGWMLNAATCATVTPRLQSGTAVGELFKGGSSTWETTTRGDYSGFQSPRGERAVGQKREPNPNLLCGPEDVHDRYTCTSHIMHSPRGLSTARQHQIRRILSNAPSEMDHPMLGLHDPGRKDRLAGIRSTSLYNDTYTAHDRKAYVTTPSEAPYPDTASLSWNDTWRMRDQLTETQKNFRWPPAVGFAAKTHRPVSQLTIE